MGQYNIGRRRSIGYDCRGTANMLDRLIEGNFDGMVEEVDEQWGILSAREESVLKDALQDLRKCAKRLRALEKRCLT